MQKAEARVGRPLEQYLPEAYRSKTSEGIAVELGVSAATAQNWLKEFGVELRLGNQRPPEAAEAVS